MPPVLLFHVSLGINSCPLFTKALKLNTVRIISLFFLQKCHQHLDASAFVVVVKADDC